MKKLIVLFLILLLFSCGVWEDSLVIIKAEECSLVDYKYKYTIQGENSFCIRSFIIYSDKIYNIGDKIELVNVRRKYE